MAVVPLRAHIIEPLGQRGIGAAQSVQIDEPEQTDAKLVSVEDTEDGGVVITIGGAQPEEKPSKDDKFDRNLADGMDAYALSALASHLLDGIEADLQSRREWEDTANMAANYLGIKLKDPSQSVAADGTISQAVATTLLEALTKIWGTHRAELLPVGGPVKVRRDKTPKPAMVDGLVVPMPPDQGIAADSDAGDDLATALETDLNHYLTQIDREYYPDFSKMLFNRALIGNAFRKVYRDPLKRRPASVWVKGQDLIVSNDCSHLSGAGRVTERIRMRQSTMRRMQAGGHYRDIPLVHPTGQVTETELAVAETEGVQATPTLPQDYEHLVYECNCELGSSSSESLFGDISRLDYDEDGRKPGFPLPYRVSLDVDSREVLEIRRGWKQDDEDYQPRKRYVKYGFIPGTGFYDLGLIHLVGNPTQAITMIQRACTDAAILGNFPAWMRLKGPGSRQTNTVLRPGPGDVIDIEAAGAAKIADTLMPFPYKDVSAAAMAMATKLEGDVKRIAGIIDLPVGEGRIGNTPVGTIMSYIEAIAQVPGAVAKDDHIAQQEEFDMLRELFSEDPASLTKGVKRPARQWQIAAELLDPDLVPAADPNTPSMIHRLMKLQGLVALGGLPQFMGIANNREIYRHAVRVLAQDNPEEFEMPEPPAQQAPPDPKIVAAQIKAQADVTKAEAGAKRDELKHQGDMAEIALSAQQKAADRESALEREKLKAGVAVVKATHEHANAALDRTHEAAQGAEDRGQAHAQHLNELAVEREKNAQAFAAPLMAPEKKDE